MFPSLRNILGRRRRGAVAIMAAVSMIPVTVMFSANLNTSQMIDDRRQVQDAADSLAIMHATWTARSLNVMAMNNVTNTQLVTVGLGSDALLTTIREQQIVAGLATGYITLHAAGCAGPDPTGLAIAACLAAHAAVAAPAIAAAAYAEYLNQTYDPKHGIDTADKAIRAINAMNKAMVSRFPRAMSEIGGEYAKVHGIDNFHFADPCTGYGARNCKSSGSKDGMALPVIEGTLQNGTIPKFCAHMNFGFVARGTSFIARGFTPGRGPLSYGGSASKRKIIDHIEDITDIDEMLYLFKEFYDTPGLGLPRLTPPGYDQWPGINLVGTQNRNGNNSFTRNFLIKEGAVCTGINVPVVGLNVTFPDHYELKDIGLTDLLVHPDQMPDAYKVLAYAQKTENTKVGDYVLGDQVDNNFGFSQVGVYNPDGADLFSARWRMEMMEATRMTTARTAGGKLDRQATSAFDELATSLNAVSDQGSWGRINAH